MSIFRNIAVTAIALISATNIFGSLYLNKNQSEEKDANVSNESVEESIPQETSTLNAEITTEINTIQTSTTVTTTAAMTETTETTVSTRGQTTTTVIEPEVSEQYRIRNLTDPVDYRTDLYDFNYDSYCVDTVKDLLFYTENDKIYKVDISSGDIEMVVDLKTQEEIDNHYANAQCHFIHLIYNTYDESVYAFANINSIQKLFNIYTQEEFTAKGFSGNYLSFSSENTICGVTCSDAYSKVSKVTEWNFKTNDIKEGFIFKDYIWNASGTFLFLQNDDYYWLNIKYNGNSDTNESKYYINHSITSICSSVEDAISSESFGEIAGIARTLFENDVYIMKSDFSVYKVNISKLKEISNNNANHDQNSVFNNDTGSLNYDDSLELYISGESIKQTGKNNITNTSNFALTKSGKIVVFDKFDRIYKVVEKN